MPKIKISLNDVRSTANSIATCGATHDSVIQAIKSAISLLDSGWEGEAKNRFKQIWSQKESTYNSFRGDISKFSTFVKDYVARMEAEDRL